VATPPPESGPRTPAGTGEPPTNGSAQTASKPNICETMNIEDVLQQATNQFQAGFSKPALQLISKALLCKQDLKMYRMAVLYACVAKDMTNAKLYFNKLPVQFQTQMTGRCQQEGITLP
jgi:hypothetical protein